MSLICTVHYLNQQKHSSVMGFSDENKKRILEAKALGEDMKGENHHELQCSSILVIFSDSHISSRPDVFCKKGVLRNFANFTGKRLCQSLFFNKVAGLTVLKKRLWLRCFLVNFTNTFSQEHLFLQNTSRGCFCSHGIHMNPCSRKYL